LPELKCKQVGGETRPAAIAVRKRMDGDQLVMKAYGDLVRIPPARPALLWIRFAGKLMA
jgi:hypothetical protein